MAWLKRHEWTILGCLAAIAFVLGVSGVLWCASSEAPGQPLAFDTWIDAIYFSVRLFKFDYDLSGDPRDVYLSSNWMLQVARILAPLTLAFAVVKGVMMAAAQWFNLWAISRWTGHAVVCGAGERGRQLALALRSEGKQVVVIEKDEHADTLDDIRRSGARVIIGSGTDPARQAEARFEQAAVVAAVTPCEESNLEVVLAASRRRSDRPLRALAHATRPFAEVFETRKPFNRIESGKECGFFDHDIAAARLLVGKYAPGLVATVLDERRPPRILLAGDGEVLPELLGVVVTQCQYAAGGIPEIVLLTVDADAFGRRFPLQHPQLGLVADLLVQVLPLPQLLRVDLGALPGKSGRRPFDLAFVACREDIDTLSAARNLLQQPASIARDIVAALRPSTQLMRLFVDEQPLAGVQAHDIVKLGCSGDVVLHGNLDLLARAIHEAYLAGEEKKGRVRGSAPALVPWEELPEGMRLANRAQADHIPIKRRTLEISRTEDVIESLAVAEHRRWMAEKVVAGWRGAAERDDLRRLHPSIRPYDELSEDERRKDRNTVLKVLASMDGGPASRESPGQEAAQLPEIH